MGVRGRTVAGLVMGAASGVQRVPGWQGWWSEWGTWVVLRPTLWVVGVALMSRLYRLLDALSPPPPTPSTAAAHAAAGASERKDS